MYWKLRRQAPSNIDSLLSADDCSLSSILEEDTLLDELKSNPNLQEFLCRDDNLDQIVALVVEEPSAELPECSRYRHAQIASSLFGVEQSSAMGLADEVACSDALLDRMWKFLDQEPPLNSLLASFFSRAMHCILQRKADLVIDYLRRKEDSLIKILQHIDTSAIMDLLLSFIVSCNSFRLRCELVEWFNECNLVERLVNLIRPENDEDKQRNSSRALAEMVRICYDSISTPSDVQDSFPLLDVLESKKTVEMLLGNMMEDTSVSAPVLRGAIVIQSMLASQQGLSDAVSGEVPIPVNEDGAKQVVAIMARWLPEFHEVLLNPPKSRPVLTTVGTIPVPLGAARLTLIQLLLVCLQTNVSSFVEEFIHLNIGSTLLDLFLAYKWNNFLHIQFEHFVSYCLHSGKVESSDISSQSLAESMIVRNNLMRQLATAGMENEAQQRSKGGRRIGYMGHVVAISNSLLRAASQDVFIAGLVQEVEADDMAVWQSWVDGPLAAANEKNNTSLGGESAKEEEEPCQEGDLPALDDIQHAFFNYQLTHVTSQFAESFSFSDEQIQSSDSPITTPFDEMAAIDFDLKAVVAAPEPDHFLVCSNARIQPFGEDY